MNSSFINSRPGLNFINSLTLCILAAKDLASLHIYTALHEPSFHDTAMSASSKIKCAGSFDLFFVLQVFIYSALLSMIMFQFSMLNS